MFYQTATAVAMTNVKIVFLSGLHGFHHYHIMHTQRLIDIHAAQIFLSAMLHILADFKRQCGDLVVIILTASMVPHTHNLHGLIDFCSCS